MNPAPPVRQVVVGLAAVVVQDHPLAEGPAREIRDDVGDPHDGEHRDQEDKSVAIRRDETEPARGRQQQREHRIDEAPPIGRRADLPAVVSAPFLRERLDAIAGTWVLRGLVSGLGPHNRP